MSSNSLPDYPDHPSPRNKSSLRTTLTRKHPQSLIVVCNPRKDKPSTKVTKEQSPFQSEINADYYGVKSARNSESALSRRQNSAYIGSTTPSSCQLYSRRSSDYSKAQSAQKVRSKKRQGVMFTMDLWSDKHFKTICNRTRLNTYTDNSGKEYKMSLRETKEGFRDIFEKASRPSTGSLSMRNLELEQSVVPLDGYSSSDTQEKSLATSIELDSDNKPVNPNSGARRNHRILKLNPKLIARKPPLFGSEASVIEELAPIKEDTEDMQHSILGKHKTGSPSFFNGYQSNPQSGIFPKNQIASPISAETIMLKTPTSLGSGVIRRFYNDSSMNSGLLSGKLKSQKSMFSAELPSSISKKQTSFFSEHDQSGIRLKTKLAKQFNCELNGIIKDCEDSKIDPTPKRHQSYVKPKRNCISDMKEDMTKKRNTYKY